MSAGDLRCRRARSSSSFPAQLSDTAGQIDLLKQVLFDTLIHPIWFFPLYYSMKEMLNGSPNIFEV
jgi:hypothetical protein